MITSLCSILLTRDFDYIYPVKVYYSKDTVLYIRVHILVPYNTDL